MPSILSRSQLVEFRKNGFVIVRGMFDADETDLLRTAMDQDPEVSGHSELEPGDAVVLHSNTLHRSAQNRSPHRRWTLMCCCNRVDNGTVTKTDDRYFIPLERVRDSR